MDLLSQRPGCCPAAPLSWPLRLFVVGIDGKIALKGNRTWYAFSVDPLSSWLRENLGEPALAERAGALAG